MFLDGWVGGGWKEVKAVFRIACSNQNGNVFTFKLFEAALL